MEWIDFKLKKPDNDSSVLATGFDFGCSENNRHYVVAYYHNGFLNPETGDDYCFIDYWQPLPEPPKE